MKLISKIAAFARFREKFQGKVAFVPTMGALHTGHAELIRRARRLAGRDGAVVVSVFVNPLQFGPNEDFERYPRPLDQDIAVCREMGADVIFHPAPGEMYPGGETVFVEENKLSAGLCGRSRPGHFRGVCTVVAKLFNIVRPHLAVFGEKDYQQLAIIRQMTRDLNFPIKIVGAPTVREADGLAISSRNRYLSAEERASAPAIRKALLAVRAAHLDGEKSAAKLLKIAGKTIRPAKGARIDYIEIVDAANLAPLKRVEGKAVIAAAVFFGTTRLIDNLALN